MSRHSNTPNRLSKETSPYLLQHAYNPVDWYPWGAEAIEKARSEDKPITIVGEADHPDTISMIDSIRESGIIRTCMMRVDSRETEALLKALCPVAPAFGLASQGPKAVVCFGTACQSPLENPRSLRSTLSEIQIAHSSGRGR